MLEMLGISKAYFKKTLPRVSGKGDGFVRSEGKKGHKPSLRQQWIILRELITTDREIRAGSEEQKDKIKNDQELKTAMLNLEGGKGAPSEERLSSFVKSVFDRG